MILPARRFAWRCVAPLVLLAAVVVAACSEDNPSAPAAGGGAPTWKQHSLGGAFHGAMMFGDSLGVAVGTGGAVYEVVDGRLGASVGPYTESSLWGVWGTSPDNYWVVGDNGEIHHFDGSDWSQYETGYTRLLVDICGGGPDDIYAVGMYGTVLHFDGTAWTLQNIGTTASVWAVSVAPGGRAFICGDDGLASRRDGSTWRSLWFPEQLTLMALWAAANDEVYVAKSADFGAVVLFEYNGSGWTEEVSGFVDPTISDLYRSPAGELYLAGASGKIYKRVSGLWSEMNVPGQQNTYAIHGASVDAILAVGFAGKAAVYDGSRWNAINEGTAMMEVCDLHAASDGDMWAAGVGLPPARFDGTDWQWPDPYALYELRSVWTDSAGTLWAAGKRKMPPDGSGVIARENAGAWTTVYSTGAPLLDMWGTAAGDVWAVGEEGVVAHYDGSDWTESVVLGGAVDLRGVWGTAGDRYYAIGDAGEVVFFDGAEWRQIGTHLSVRLNGVWGFSSTEVYTVGDDGTMLVDEGLAWGEVAVPTSVDLFGIWGSGTDDLYLVGAYGRIFHRNAAGWTQMDSPARSRLNTIFAAPDGRIFAGGVNGLTLVLE